MNFTFGDFELDEERREVTLRGKPLAVQPKVFDLMTYLVRNAGRVVSKSELLDQLWPSLHVTESSLQRAVSLLRSALREGGLDKALKSYSGRGYRLAVDLGDLRPFLDRRQSSGIEASQHLKELAAARAWSRISDMLQGQNTSALSLGDLAVWALAEQCLGRPLGAISLLQQIVERSEAEGIPDNAAETAVTLARIYFEKGDLAVTRGWLLRANSNLDGSTEATKAYLLWLQSRIKAFEGRAETALEIATQALAAAEAGGSTRLRALAMAYAGFYNISLGRTQLGLEQQNHAAALAMSSNMDPITGGLIYCNILWSCRSSADWSRAVQWVGSFETWCEANFAGISAACHLHRAEVTGAQGTLADALQRVEEALHRLPASELWATGDAHRVRGDIYAAMGNIAAARADYKKAYEMGWDAEPGNAVLLAEAGDVNGAIAALDRVLVDTGWFGLQRRGLLLAHKARICATAGRVEDTHSCIALLRNYYETWPSQAIHALVQEAKAMIAFHEGTRGPSAAQAMSLARQLWTSVGAEYDVARVRLALARIMLENDDIAGAQIEAHVCATIARKIGARLLLEDVTKLLQVTEQSAPA